MEFRLQGYGLSHNCGESTNLAVVLPPLGVLFTQKGVFVKFGIGGRVSFDGGFPTGF